jgi:hypothetical protein
MGATSDPARKQAHPQRATPIDVPVALRHSGRHMKRKRLRFRPPGLKPTTKVGTIGPYRGRLGLAWVIAPIVVATLIVVAGYLALTR